MDEPSHYEVLGVPDTADADAVRAAYRSRARALHPDRRSGADGADGAMARLNEAYRTLRDADRRRSYDAGRGAGAWSTTAGGSSAAAQPQASSPSSSPPPVTGAPPRHRGAGCMVGVVFAAVLLVGVVVGLLLGSDGGGGGADPVDGEVGIGSCLAVAADASLREVGCAGPHDAVVVAVVAPDQTCPPGTRAAGSPTTPQRLCVV